MLHLPDFVHPLTRGPCQMRTAYTASESSHHPARNLQAPSLTGSSVLLFACYLVSIGTAQSEWSKIERPGRRLPWSCGLFKRDLRSRVKNKNVLLFGQWRKLEHSRSKRSLGDGFLNRRRRVLAKSRSFPRSVSWDPVMAESTEAQTAGLDGIRPPAVGMMTYSPLHPPNPELRSGILPADSEGDPCQQ